MKKRAENTHVSLYKGPEARTEYAHRQKVHSPVSLVTNTDIAYQPETTGLTTSLHTQLRRTLVATGAGVY